MSFGLIEGPLHANCYSVHAPMLTHYLMLALLRMTGDLIIAGSVKKAVLAMVLAV